MSLFFFVGKNWGSFSRPPGRKCAEFLAQGFEVFGGTRNGAPIFGAKNWRSFWRTVWRSFWYTFWRSFWFQKLAQFVCSLFGAVAFVAEHDYSNIKNGSGEHSCAFRLRISQKSCLLAIGFLRTSGILRCLLKDSTRILLGFY